jgi:hypothetical protein
VRSETVVAIGTGRVTSAASAPRSARRDRRATTVVATAGAAVIAGLCGVVTVAAARAGVGTPSVDGDEWKRTHGFGVREPDDDVLHRFKRESVASVDVGNKLLVGFLVARCFREVEAHEGDEGEDVLNRHGGHVAELRHAGVDGCDIVR